MKALLRRFKDDQRGFALTELLVVTLMAAPLLAVVGGFSLLGIRSESRAAARSQTIVRAQNALYRITRELREAKSVSNFGIFPVQKPHGIQVQRADGTYYRVLCTEADLRVGHAGDKICGTYDAAGLTSIRRHELIQGVRNYGLGLPVFEISSSGDFITVTIRIHPSGQAGDVTLKDGVRLRNVVG